MRFDIYIFSPKCRVKVTGKKKNVVINGILEAFLKAYPQKRPVLKPIDNTACKIKPINEVCLKIKRILLEISILF